MTGNKKTPYEAINMTDEKKTLNKQECVEALSELSLEFFGESLDRVFENFHQCTASGSEEDMVYASVSAWQLSNSISKFFREVALQGLKAGYADKAKSQEIANAMSRHFQAQMKVIGESVAASKERPGGVEPYETTK